ncbi:MAG: TonB-dependent receptor, partial [Sphingobacteriales bacterium]
MESRQKIQISFFSFLFSFIFLTSAFAQNGTVKGSIHTSDGKPAEFVNVILKEIKKGTVTDVNGAFVLNNLKEGNYTITTSFVGLKTQERQISVFANQTLTLAFTLEENAQQLNEVVITASRSLNEKQVNIGKLPIKLMDLPQSVVTLEKDVLERQQTVRLSDAIKNINGIYLMSTTGGTQEELAGRGFAYNSSNTFKNGTRFNNAVMPEMSALERIEVMKGSNAILYGNVAAGGIINLVTKKPQFENGGELNMRIGSYGFYKPSLDIYGKFNNSEKAAYRINTT